MHIFDHTVVSAFSLKDLHMYWENSIFFSRQTPKIQVTFIQAFVPRIFYFPLMNNISHKIIFCGSALKDTDVAYPMCCYFSTEECVG